jgi:hypothetical protein
MLNPEERMAIEVVISLGSRKQMALGELASNASPRVQKFAKKKIENGGAGECKCSQGVIASTQLVLCIRYHYQLKVSSDCCCVGRYIQKLEQLR